MNRKEIIAAIQAAAKNDRIPCEKARSMARKLGISKPEFGRICNELNIKISACGFGWF